MKYLLISPNHLLRYDAQPRARDSRSHFVERHARHDVANLCCGYAVFLRCIAQILEVKIVHAVEMVWFRYVEGGNKALEGDLSNWYEMLGLKKLGLIETFVFP